MDTQTKQDDLLKNLRVLNQIGASIMSEQTPEQIIETVYHYVNQLMDAYSFGIGIYNAETMRFEYTGSRENDRKLPYFSIDVESPGRFSGWVFANKKEILINDFKNEYQQYLPTMITAMQGLEPVSLMYVPVLIDQEIAAILSVRTPVKNAYNQQSLEILKTLAVFISKALENFRYLVISNKRPTLPASYLLDPLTSRELEVLQRLGKGYTNKVIAQELFISASTVKTHTLNIYRKLETGNRTQAIAKAREFGLFH